MDCPKTIGYWLDDGSSEVIMTKTTIERGLEPMQAAQIINPSKAQVTELGKPEPDPNEVLIEVKRAGICGTDLHIWHGSYELANYPVVPGHEFSGTVSQIGDQVKNFSVGDRVTVDPNLPCHGCFFCQRKQFNQCLNLEAVGVTRNGAFAQYVVAPESNVFSIGDLPFGEAALIEPLACVTWGLERVPLNAGDSMLIFGAGPMGILIMQAVKSAGASYVAMIDTQPSRLKLAEQLGADATFEAKEFNLGLAHELSPYGFDVVTDATGIPSVMENSIQYLRAGGRFWIFGVAPDGSQAAFPPAVLFRKDLSIISSFAINKSFTEAIALVNHGAVNLKPLISHTLPLEEFESALDLAEHSPERMKVQISLGN